VRLRDRGTTNLSEQCKIMKIKILLAATAALALCAGVAAKADPYEPYGSNPDHYYSSNDHSGYYDRSGTYHRFAADPGYYGPPPGPGPRYRPSGYYYNPDNDVECHRRNTAGGTIAGAIAGGVIGGAASHGNGGAVVGGAILGGLVGNSLSQGVECEDRSYAYDSYYRGLSGPIGVRVDWRNDRYGNYGYFTPIREYRRGGYTCRDYRTVTYRHGREYTRSGRACRRVDGNWYFD
jgi:surface antigen